MSESNPKRSLFSRKWLLLFPLFIFGLLVGGGYLATRQPATPVVEDRPLWDWVKDLHDGTIGLGSSSTSRSNAVQVIQRNGNVAMATGVTWSKRTSSKLERAFEEMIHLYLVLRRQKESPYAYGRFAHEYRGQGAMILGILATNHPSALARLRQMVKDPEYTDYEKELARRFIDDIDRGIAE